MSDSTNNTESKIINAMQMIDYKYINAMIIIFLIIYIVFLVPIMPFKLSCVFDNWIMKIVVLFLIAFVVSKNVVLGMILALAFIVTLMSFSEKRSIIHSTLVGVGALLSKQDKLKKSEGFSPLSQAYTLDFDEKNTLMYGKMAPNEEPEFPSHSSHSDIGVVVGPVNENKEKIQENNQEGNQEGNNLMLGIEQNMYDDLDMDCSSVNGTEIIVYDNATAEHVDDLNN